MTFDGWDHLLRLEIDKESAEPYIYTYLHFDCRRVFSEELTEQIDLTSCTRLVKVRLLLARGNVCLLA